MRVALTAMSFRELCYATVKACGSCCNLFMLYYRWIKNEKEITSSSTMVSPDNLDPANNYARRTFLPHSSFPTEDRTFSLELIDSSCEF